MAITKKIAIDPMNARLVEEIEAKLIELDKKFDDCTKLIRPRASSVVKQIRNQLSSFEGQYINYIANQIEDGKSIHLGLNGDGAVYFFNRDAINEKLPELVFRAIGDTPYAQRLTGGVLYSALIRERRELRAKLADLTDATANGDILAPA